jgi:hypothetical protein
MDLRPIKVMKHGSCSAPTVHGGTTLPFVISTGAQRSGEICVPFLEMSFRQSETWATHSKSGSRSVLFDRAFQLQGEMADVLGA